MNNNPTITPQVVNSPFRNFCMSIGAIPTSYQDSLDYYETLLWLIKFLDETVIPAVSTNGNAVAELQSFYIQLQSYVNNYFDNLDVQEEINNKLDDMVEQGTLQEIIADYLNSKAVFGFDNVSDMKASTNLLDGSYAKTLGYYSVNDGGSAVYKIREITNTDVVDEGSIIALNDNTLIAELIPTDYISIYQFGAKGDGTTDDTDFIQNAINYSKNNNYIKIIGETERTSAITKTLKFHAYNQVENLYLDVKSNSLTNNYMISVNSNNVSSWDIQYPDSTKGYFKNVKLENSNQIENINGIFNGANNRYERINTIKLNTSFYNIHSYLDIVKIFNIQVDRKIGTDYAIDFGSLGDACELNTAHMYGTIGTPNFITGTYGHNAITMKNLICNGNLNISGGNVSIENIHSESGQVTIDNAIVKITNGFFYHNNPNITITNSFVVLNQLEFAYYSTRYNYSSTNDIDINITNSNVEINECYKTVKANDIAEKITSFVKTNLDSQPTYNPNKRYYKGNVKPNEIKCNTKSNTRSVAYPQLSEKVKWYEATGTYYYKVIPLVDSERMLKIPLYDGGGNIELTNGEKGFRFAAADNGMYRVYRGTAQNTFDKYVDIAINGGSIQDDGFFCNGYKWNDRTPGNVETFMSVPDGTTVEYVGDNIRTFRNNIPDLGTWKKGDIVYNSNLGDNLPSGWICIEGGTSGTWREI